MIQTKKWRSRRLRELVLPVMTIDPRKQPDTSFRYIDIGSIDNKAQRILEPKVFGGLDAPSRARRLVRKGDVLFSTVRPYLKNIALVPEDMDGCLTSTGICVLRPGPDVDERFLYYAVCRNKFVEEVSQTMDGSLYPAVKDSDILAMEIPVPPLKEQKRIVDQIEEMMERSQRARLALENAMSECKLLHSSLLLHGVTAGNQLKAPENFLYSGEITSLPKDWCLQRLGSIVTHGPKNGYSPKSNPTSKGTQTLKLSATTSRFLIINEFTTKRIEESIDFDSDLWLQPGDLLVQRANTMEYVGTAVVYNGPQKTFIYPDLMMRLRFSNKLLGYWVSYILNSHFGRIWVRNVATGTAGNMPKISGTRLKQMWVPVPPTEVLSNLVHQIREATKQHFKVEAHIREQLESLEQLEQIVLENAIRGDM